MSGQSDAPNFRARPAVDGLSGSTSRLQAIDQARKLRARLPVYLDTETTGLEMSDQIVEICVVDHDGRVLVDTLVRPQRRISGGAARVHHITDEMLRNAPTWADVWPQLAAILANRPVAIYNADFDVRLMQQSHRGHRLAWTLQADQFTCIMQLYALYAGQRDPRRGSYRWHSLEDAGRQCGIALPNSHRAQADAVLARALLHRMAESR